MKITEYIKDTKGELKHVNWPSKRETLVYTGLVIAISVAIAYFLGVFDHLFTIGLKAII